MRIAASMVMQCAVGSAFAGSYSSQFVDRKDPSNIVQEYCYEIAVWMFYLVFR